VDIDSLGQARELSASPVAHRAQQTVVLRQRGGEVKPGEALC
jgi:hypothetical protein